LGGQNGHEIAAGLHSLNSSILNLRSRLIFLIPRPLLSIMSPPEYAYLWIFEPTLLNADNYLKSDDVGIYFSQVQNSSLAGRMQRMAWKAELHASLKSEDWVS
jgi:hypothetical protein